MKVETKKLLVRVMAILMCFAMMMPILANVFATPTVEQQTQDQEQMLAEAGFDEEQIQQMLYGEAEGSYLVTEVVSTDTYKIKWGDEERTMKLIGVDGDNSKESLETVREMTNARLLSLEFDAVEEDKDENLLAYAYLEDGQFLNRMILMEGLGKVKEETENVKYQEELQSAQVHAKNSGFGIWSQDN